VQEALLDVARFWLDRGVDGFRLDTINFYFHDPGSARQPAARAGGAQRLHRARGEPLQHQEHLYDKNQPENLEFLRGSAR
jgi:alpha-glucosidase